MLVGQGGLCGVGDGPVCDKVDLQTHYTPQVKRSSWRLHAYLHSASANNGASSDKDCSLRGNGLSKLEKGELQKDTVKMFPKYSYQNWQSPHSVAEREVRQFESIFFSQMLVPSTKLGGEFIEQILDG